MLRGKSLKMFRGYIRTKHNDTVVCERRIGESYEFNADIPFDECKLEKSVSFYRKLYLIVKIVEIAFNKAEINLKNHK